MIDISPKEDVLRIAIAKGEIFLKKETIEAIKNNKVSKGDVLTTAQIAAINAAKRCYEIIPLCHPIPITSVEVNFEIKDDKIIAEAKVKAYAKTGVEMEALVAVTTALLTIWDMVKSLEKEDGQYPYTKISNVRVVEKIKLCPKKEHEAEFKGTIDFGILTISTSRYKEKAEDPSGDFLAKFFNAKVRSIVPDDKEKIKKEVLKLLNDVDVLIITGGTGIAKDDVTIEACRELFEKEIEGFGELFRMLSYKEIGTASMLSRATAGIIGNKVVFCLPGSLNACKLGAKLIESEARHILALVRK